MIEKLGTIKKKNNNFNKLSNEGYFSLEPC